MGCAGLEADRSPRGYDSPHDPSPTTRARSWRTRLRPSTRSAQVRQVESGQAGAGPSCYSAVSHFEAEYTRGLPALFSHPRTGQPPFSRRGNVLSLRVSPAEECVRAAIEEEKKEAAEARKKELGEGWASGSGRRRRPRHAKSG